jgi:hypothetical protein
MGARAGSWATSAGSGCSDRPAGDRDPRLRGVGPRGQRSDRKQRASGCQHPRADASTLAWLEATAPLVKTGTADQRLAALWTTQRIRIAQDTATWEQALGAIATRYFAGHGPLFASEAAQLRRVHDQCAHVAAQSARQRVRRAGAASQREIGMAASALVTQLVAGARAEVELVFGARPGLIYVQERIAATRTAGDSAQ